MMPITMPCSRKISITLRADAPIVLRMAMSRVFSITSSIERRDDVERGHADDEADADAHGDLLELQRGIERAVHVGPVRWSCSRCRACRGIASAISRRVVDVVDAQLE